MSLKLIHDKLAILKKTPSTNEKVCLLKEYLKNETFKRVICLMYGEEKHFKVQKLPKFSPPKNGFIVKPTNEALFSFLDTLAYKKGASNNDKQNLSRLASVDKETYEVVKRIINKDAKCGFGGKTINKACSDLLFLMPYCRCSTEKKKGPNIDYDSGAYGQEKADGMFANAIIGKHAESLIRSRNGNIVHQMDHIHDFFKKIPLMFCSTVYMGELLICIDGKIIERKTGNGYLNSCLQNAAPSDKAIHAILKLWDAVPQKDFWNGKCNIPYKKRLARVSAFVKAMDNPMLSVIDTKIIFSVEESDRLYRKMRQNGKEGTIVKNKCALWKDYTSPDQIKKKNKSDAELRIVSWKYGKEDTRFADCMGSVQLKSDDDLVFVSVSGFTDEERLLDWDERIGKVATMEFEGLTSDKSKPGIYSLYLPQNLEMRPDRTYTDTLKDLKTR